MFFCRIRSREKCPKEPTCQHFLSPLHDPNGALDVEPHLETLLKGLHLLLFHSSLVDEIGILGESRILLSIVATRRDIGQPAFVPRDWSRGCPDDFRSLIFQTVACKFLPYSASLPRFEIKRTNGPVYRTSRCDCACFHLFIQRSSRLFNTAR